MLPKKTLVLLIIIVAAILAIGIWFGSWVLSLKNSNPVGPSKYSAVYMATGDIYFGELHWFPKPHLTNVWFLQKSVSADNQTSFGVAPFRSAFWGPADEIYLNPSQIIFFTNLRNDSQVVRVLDNSALVNQTGPSLPAGPPSTNTFQGPPGPPPLEK